MATLWHGLAPAQKATDEMAHLFTFLTLTLTLLSLMLLYEISPSGLTRNNSTGTIRQRIYILRHKISFIENRLHHLVHDLNRVQTNLAHVRMMMEICETNNSQIRWEYFAAHERSLFKELCLLTSERMEKENSLGLMRNEMQAYIDELYLITTTDERSTS